MAESASRLRFQFHEAPSSTVPGSHIADFVLVFQYELPSKSQPDKIGPKGLSRAAYEEQTLQAYHDALAKLTHAGLLHETRPGNDDPDKNDQLLVFITCPWEVLKREVTRGSINDWLSGIKITDTQETEALLRPSEGRDNSLDNLPESERLRVIHALITGMPSEGGVGIYPGQDEYIASIMPLHNKEFNKNWLKSWSKKWIVDEQDLSMVRNHFGESVAYYFEFLQFYFQWLAAPTALGLFIHFFGSAFSAVYSMFVLTWAVGLTEFWKRREKELALWWGVRGVSKSESRRPDFQGDSMVVDSISGQIVPFFPEWKRWTRKAAGVPVIMSGALALGLFITAVFGVEVFLTIYYEGPFKSALVHVPLVLYSLAIPTVATFCKGVAKQLTDFENHETRSAYNYNLMQKVFIFNALVGYTSILLTAYVYVPFGPTLITFVQSRGVSFSTITIEPAMLQNRLKAFMITTQTISFITETIVPWLARRATVGVAKVQQEVAEKLHHEKKEAAGADANEVVDSPEVQKFLKQVRAQVALPVYDINEDYTEMVLQFGYVSLFSVVWPLTGLCAFVNNWIELRSDAAKICFNTRRPIPSRSDTIGPWIDNMQVIAWLSSLSNASIVYLFNGTMGTGKEFVSPRMALGGFLLTILVSEHFYILLKTVVSKVLDSIPTDADMLVRRKEFGVKNSWLSRLNLNKVSLSSATNGPQGVNPDAGLASGVVDSIGSVAIRSSLRTK